MIHHHHCTWIHVHYTYIPMTLGMIIHQVLASYSQLDLAYWQICLTTYVRRNRWSNVIGIKETWPQISVAMSSRGMLGLASTYGHVWLGFPSMKCLSSCSLQLMAALGQWWSVKSSIFWRWAVTIPTRFLSALSFLNPKSPHPATLLRGHLCSLITRSCTSRF